MSDRKFTILNSSKLFTDWRQPMKTKQQKKSNSRSQMSAAQSKKPAYKVQRDESIKNDNNRRYSGSFIS